ncbi:MAG TPA: adenylate/guanylate cyclase domain-containing protein [Thermoanaerobaculia bacterium]|jgi:adenylate cyclase
MRLGALCAAIVAAILFLSPTFFGAEWWLFDRYSRRLAESRPADPRIVLVTVSDESVRALAELYGRPQSYSREVWALAVDELKRAGAAAIAFDILFSEENPAAPEGDRAFAAALDGAPVILATTSRTRPHPMFAAKVGAIDLERETSTTHVYPLRQGTTPSLALAALEQFATSRGAAGFSPPSSSNGRRAEARRSTRDDDSLLIRWNGAKAKPADLSYAHVGLDKLVLAALMRQEGSLTPALAEAFAKQFRGKIVLVGYTAAGLLDLRANPLSPIAPGVELHANAIDNLINHDFNRATPRAVAFPILILLGAAVGFALDRTRSQLISGAIAALGIVAVLAIGYGALVAGFAIPAFTAAVVIGITYVVITAMKFVQEQRQTALLKATFGRYVSPQILDHILAHPEKVRLGGERRDLTILFSDIRGFTSISEASEPEEVVEMLNEYLTRMVEILLAHGGTLDKFIGDAVMGFWNAPANDPDHARHAVACAVEMIEETARLRERWASEGKASLRIGVGVNTGEAVAGNIGSERVFGYTVIGDAVNLASRLEGKNKDYGTEVIVSESTLERMGDGFETVYLDDVKVKGKERAVKIYEVKGRR